MEDKFIEVNENGEDVLQSYRINLRGTTVEEQNSMTAMIASICYILLCAYFCCGNNPCCSIIK